MKKILSFVLVSFVFLNVSLIIASEDHEENHAVIFEHAKEIIGAGTSCADLGEEDLEALGEYYMEQMHPGEAHERMDAMMGGEGSESLRQAHLAMGGRFYCNEDSDFGMMGGGMMNNYPGSYSNGSPNFAFWLYNMIIPITLIVAGIALSVYLIKYCNRNKRRKIK